METIDRCIQSLKTSTSDSEKLAALMVISKVCETVSIEEDLAVQLFEAISPTFLARLLKTNPSVPINAFKVVGINILSFFARTVPAILLKNEEDEQLINEILDIFNPSKKSENCALYQDSLDICLCLVNLDTGANVLLRKNVFTLFGHVILEEDLTEKVISIFQSLLYHHGRLNEDFIKYLNVISHSFQSNQELLKFQYLKIITKLFQIIVNCKFEINYVEDGFTFILKNISVGCKDIMQSRVKADVKRSIIVLLCSLMRLCGKEWIFDMQCVEPVSNFIVLLLTVISVELTFLFHSKITEDELNDQRSVESGLFIAQSVLNFICSNSFEYHALVTDSSFISHIFSTLKSIMTSVYEFLSNLDQNNDLCLHNPILVSAISMLSTWATEETENLREELLKVLPFLMKVGKNDLKTVKENDQTPIVLDIMAPCIMQIIPEKKMRTILVSNECHDLYIQYLSYSLTVGSSSTKPENLESLFHMMHQFTILEPKLCSENSNFKDLSMKLLMFILNLSSAYQLSSYSCLEIIIVTLTFVRMYKMEYTNSIEQAIKVSIQFVYELTEKSFDDDNVAEIWFIAVQNIIACFGMYKQLVKSFENVSYLKGWSSKFGITEDMKDIIDELVSFIRIT